MSALFAAANVQFVLRTLLRLGAPTREAEDLAQEVFVIVHRRAAEFDTARRAEPWLYGIARNVLREHQRRARSRPEALGAERDAADLERGAERPVGAIDGEVAALRRAIAGLPEPLQDVLILCDLVELTLPEAALELAIPPDTAKDRLRRARAQLRADVARIDREVGHG